MDRQLVEEVIESLDVLLHSDSTIEDDYQAWFEKYPLVLHLLGFIRQIPHPIIHTASGNEYIPDFIAQRANGAWEIVELKTATANILLNKDRREKFYASFESYISQCHEYSEALDDSSARIELEERYDINQMQKRPSSLIIAGSSEALDVDRLLRLCSRENPPITIYTYDDVRSILMTHRILNFGNYDLVDGISIHSVMYIHKSNDTPSVNHILDIGVNSDRDRVSIYFDEQGVLWLRVFDSNGEKHVVHSSTLFDEQFYEVAHRFLFEVGISDGFGFLSIQIDGRYYADIKIQEFPFRISHEYVIGTDWYGKEPSWFSCIELAVIDRALSFDEKIQVRAHSANAGEQFSAEMMDFKWSAIYLADAENPREFNRDKWMHTAGHPLDN